MAFIRDSPSLIGKGAQTLLVAVKRGLHCIPTDAMFATFPSLEHSQVVCRCLSIRGQGTEEATQTIDAGRAGGLPARQNSRAIRRNAAVGAPVTGILSTNSALAGVA